MATIAAALAALAQAECPVLIIGANALEAHGYSRFTLDVDCMIAASSLEQLKTALARHGFQHAGKMSSFHEFWFEGKPGGMPIHAMFVDEATFAKMWPRRTAMPLKAGTTYAPCVSHLIALKLHAAKNNPTRRHKDMTDVLALLECNPQAVTREELAKICALYASPECIGVLKEQHYL